MNVLVDEYEHSAPETLHSTHELTNVKDPVIEKNGLICRVSNQVTAFSANLAMVPSCYLLVT